MDYKGPYGINVLEGLEVVRRRPGMFIGAAEEHPSPRARLVEYLVSNIAQELAQEVRILLWREGAVTVAYDGIPLPIVPFGRPVDGGVSHPALYEYFMDLASGGRLANLAVLNALSERLVVSTMLAGDRYRVFFSKGMIARLLSREHCDRPLGSTWLTFLPDAVVVAGKSITPSEADEIVERIERNAGGVRIHVEDRMTQDADWS
jgi:DNA gyrase/topoisomerase IV subunit B